MEVRQLVEEFLERYAAAWNDGDVDAIVACWDLPAFTLSDERGDAHSGAGDIRAHATAAVAAARARGIDRRSLSSLNVAALSSRILRVDVIWSVQGGASAVEAREHDAYLLRLGDDDRPKMRVAVHLAAAPT